MIALLIEQDRTQCCLRTNIHRRHRGSGAMQIAEGYDPAVGQYSIGRETSWKSNRPGRQQVKVSAATSLPESGRARLISIEPTVTRRKFQGWFEFRYCSKVFCGSWQALQPLPLPGLEMYRAGCDLPYPRSLGPDGFANQSITRRLSFPFWHLIAFKTTRIGSQAARYSSLWLFDRHDTCCLAWAKT